MPLFSKGTRVKITPHPERPWMADVVGYTGLLDDAAQTPGHAFSDTKKYFWFRPDRGHNYRLSVFVVREDEIEVVTQRR